MNRNGRHTRGFARYIRRTFMNKLYAIALLGTGVASTFVSEGDATMLVLISFFAVPMFFSKKNWIM